MKRFLKLLSTFLSPYSMASEDPIVAFTLVEEGSAILIDSREEEALDQGMIEGAIWFPLSTTVREDWRSMLLPELENYDRIFIYGDERDSAGKLRELLKTMGIESVDLGTFHSLEGILPLRTTHHQHNLSDESRSGDFA